MFVKQFMDNAVHDMGNGIDDDFSMLLVAIDTFFWMFGLNPPFTKGHLTETSHEGQEKG